MGRTHKPPNDGWNAVAIDIDDNVAVALAELSGVAYVLAGGQPLSLHLSDTIPMGHKLAIKPIAKGEAVLKYGQPIGNATADIPAGAHVHVQNVVSGRAAVARSDR